MCSDCKKCDMNILKVKKTSVSEHFPDKAGTFYKSNVLKSIFLKKSRK